MNDMLNSLYDLPVPKPFTPVNLSVVGIDLIFPLFTGKTAEGRGGQKARQTDRLLEEYAALERRLQKGKKKKRGMTTAG